MCLGNQYYKYSSILQNQPDLGYPKPVTVWHDSLQRVDAVTSYEDYTVHFYSNGLHYIYSETENSVCTGKMKLYLESLVEILNCSISLRYFLG